jgi:signal transduction histidine kinase
LLLGLIVVLALAIWGGFLVIKWALAPVKKITETADEITSHRLDKRLPSVESGDEIASLSKTLNQMIARLDESFQSVNRFTADASHELRTPLTIIRGELETSLLDKDLSENVRETIYSLIEETDAAKEGTLGSSRQNVQVLQAELGRMQTMVNYATITAPFSGISRSRKRRERSGTTSVGGHAHDSCRVFSGNIPLRGQPVPLYRIGALRCACLVRFLRRRDDSRAPVLREAY